MFAYLSLLVQSGAMDEVNLSFLIAGHTHCPLDQYFLCLAKLLIKPISYRCEAPHFD
jgi:hypothetical protein